MNVKTTTLIMQKKHDRIIIIHFIIYKLKCTLKSCNAMIWLYFVYISYIQRNELSRRHWNTPWNTRSTYVVYGCFVMDYRNLAIISDSKLEIFGPFLTSSPNKFDNKRKLEVWTTLVNYQSLHMISKKSVSTCRRRTGQNREKYLAVFSALKKPLLNHLNTSNLGSNWRENSRLFYLPRHVGPSLTSGTFNLFQNRLHRSLAKSRFFYGRYCAWPPGKKSGSNRSLSVTRRLTVKLTTTWLVDTVPTII